jgi:hypothetical protein
MAAVIEVKYFNSFVLKKTSVDLGDDAVAAWNGSPGVPSELGGFPVETEIGIENWNLEEARIRGGYNNTSVDFGVKAYLVEDEPNGAVRGNSLIYSGIYNSRTGINNTNVFSVAESITKSADPVNGSIQKLYAEDTNLIVFQESKVSRALIDKDAIYTAEGSSSISNVNTTIGTIQPYTGEFGISKDPTSFAVYGYRKYFTDKNRNAVLRLSRDGITEISNNGMYSYFRDEFNAINTSGTIGTIKGGYDIHTKQFILSTQQSPLISRNSGSGKTVMGGSDDSGYGTLSFDEKSNGWTSFYSYKPDQMFSLKNKYYTMKGNVLYAHHVSGSSRGQFYGVSNSSSVQLTLNPSVSSPKIFRTMNYEGSNGWEVSYFKGKSSSIDESINDIYDEANPIYSYDEGIYIDNYVTYRAGFNRKEGKYFATVKNNSAMKPGEIISGLSVSGVKGFFANVTIKTDATTDPGGYKELFAVSSDYIESSY